MKPSDGFETLQNLLGYRFGDEGLLHRALVHRSYLHENPHLDEKDNETLEFLGDAVLGLAISHFLLEHFPDYNEGELSRLRSAIVNERELTRIAVELNLGEYLLLGKGEEMTGGRRKASLLADSLEALLASIYLDGGLEAVLGVIKKLFDVYLRFEKREHVLKALDKDYKTQLQELTQARYKLTPVYVLDREEGPDHDKTFHMNVVLEGQVLAGGSGKSKKDAQQAAAEKALQIIAADSWSLD
ncbi:MAG TPA: ribonuclease III [Syntrophobacter fumaroxidans]|nr:ribonuclease III [Syntrophobacter fumaroxidans]